MSSRTNEHCIIISRNNCHFCGINAKVRLCSDCKVTRYCSRECQKSDWSEHKLFCSSNRFAKRGTSIMKKMCDDLNIEFILEDHLEDDNLENKFGLTIHEYYTKLLGLDETYHIICISAEMELNERY